MPTDSAPDDHPRGSAGRRGAECVVPAVLAVAPVQAVFVPIVKKGADAAAVEGAVAAAAAAAKAAGLRIKVDATEGKTPGCAPF